LGGSVSEKSKDDTTKKSTPNGSMRTSINLCRTDSKLLVTFALGSRNSEVTETFIADLEKRLVRAPHTNDDDRPQLSTDGFGPYPGAIARKFGRTVGMAC
jgi:hypothetical protein